MQLIGKTNFDFVGKRRTALIFSLVAVLGTTLLLTTRGLNLGVDFAGGTEIQLKFSKDVDANTLRNTMKEIGFDKASVQVFGEEGTSEYLVRVERMSLLTPEEHGQIVSELKGKHGEQVTVGDYDPNKGDAVEVISTEEIQRETFDTIVKDAGLALDEVRALRRGTGWQYTLILEGVSKRLTEQLEAQVGEGTVDLRRVEYVGPQVGKELRRRGFLSLFYACIFILIYLAIRFDFSFAPGAVVALAHDAFLAVGLYAVTGLEFNLTSIAAILTIIGYSVNDTVVIYDRVRENRQRFSGRGLSDLINQSINETLSRTLITSGTTVLALIGLLVYAQGTIRDFAIAMTFGILVGTYSTVFIASPMVLALEGLINKKLAKSSTARA
ncbi:MAG: protein translocase subunit SecF [Deltaproteobacteria bacterium]|nr:protein translocase subunit SecF [Deltaproteobacteria bacterium]